MRYSSLHEEKPLAEFDRIISALQSQAKKIECPANKKLTYLRRGVPVCYLILEGSATIRREGDSLVLGVAKGPTILGLTNMLHASTEQYYCRAESVLSVYYISDAKARDVIGKLNLWEDLCKVLSFIIYHQAKYTDDMVAQSAHEVICNNILKLMKEPEEVRDAISVARYVQERTLYSRSGIMRTIATLKQNGKIRLEDGHLREVLMGPLEIKK
ncbi:MAG TPA: helix-turn-helix domain-containing protein [Scandinavium sp.]|jgi:hypothetical protein|uniref:helix-turn-helix domain-containing protein n=1 Tax=Scandinavium sp. TaxID=2830653 RepID=UPI002E2FDADA|nr:helix-turn-helix domain-containing protein [Scandinavium sp.]HEX4501805.1 helix-turn-helix domain-containing protein [Scandinavium sp.]